MRLAPILLLTIIASAILTFCGCQAPQPTQGIAVQTVQCKGDLVARNLGIYKCLSDSIYQPLPNTPAWGVTYPPYYDYIDANGIDETQGTVTIYGNSQNPLAFTTGPNGLVVVNNARAPAYWSTGFAPTQYCGQSSTKSGLTYSGTGFVDGTQYFLYENPRFLIPNYYPSEAKGNVFECILYDSLLPASTRFAILGNLPSFLTLGTNVTFTTQNGLPLLYVYDGTGTLVTTETATSVSSDGSEATFPFPSSLTQNGYSLAVLNQIPDSPGSLATGTNLLSIASSQTIEGNPFGVAAQDTSTSWQSADNSDPYGDQTCAGQWQYNSGTYTNSSPVVTLYSLNQVNNGGVAIPVGTNPTAIVLYDSQYNPDERDDGPCHAYRIDTTQMTRAVVANSGSNTVSVLDIVNNAVLSTITVGNQPVALAVSSDGSTAYVANYTDSTITQVNLNTETVTATIAAGGQPTSVALTAAGTLWVGGVGFLTKLNANPMGVVATESVPGKMIAALGFSNSVNQLVATTVDTSGNVYADEINPTTVQGGGVYSPLASNMVSSVGTHLVHNAGVRAFTSTLASSSLVSANQVGAPPLVVQDGWAVVTATPTGFTITDITGQIVLVSETTPSPVTAIAIDSKLNAAYLVMPDSNILLTVPLPGTN